MLFHNGGIFFTQVIIRLFGLPLILEQLTFYTPINVKKKQLHCQQIISMICAQMNLGILGIIILFEF